MDIQDTRPVEVDLHPVCNQRYLIPTFSIGETYALVLKVIRRRDSGLVIWGHTRYGKTWAMLYCQQCLTQDFPDFPVVIYNAKREYQPRKVIFITHCWRWSVTSSGMTMLASQKNIFG